MIRYPAARKVVESLLHGSIVRMPVTDAIIDMAARMLMTAVDIDEQRQRAEEILGKSTTAAEEPK